MNLIIVKSVREITVFLELCNLQFLSEVLESSNLDLFEVSLENIQLIRCNILLYIRIIDNS